MDNKIAEIIVDLLNTNGPMARIDIEREINSQFPTKKTVIGNAVVKMKINGVVRMIGDIKSKPMYELTGKAGFDCCNDCEKSHPIWRIKGGKCASCRRVQSNRNSLARLSSTSSTKDSMFQEFDEARSFNNLLRLPFGLPSQRYAECL